MSQPPPPARDRRQILLAPGAAYNGIDFVDVAQSQTQLYVHFLNTVPIEGTLVGTSPVTITGGEVITSITVEPLAATAWTADSEGRPVLAVSVLAAGDFSTYELSIDSTQLDPFFSSVGFSFKANCVSTLDCETPVPSCPPETPLQVPIDYTAKDFGSFTQALSEFSAVRYPAWVERSEADFGVVMMEALSAMADELSYYQDRVAAESTIETATQRLSVLRHARLVDYEPAPATVATTQLQLQVSAAGEISTPLQCRAIGADGSLVSFEVGGPLADPVSGEIAAVALPVDVRWNRGNLATYYWDDTAQCLLAGSVVLYLQGHGLGLYSDQQLLLDSPAADSADPPVREIVSVSTWEETRDPVLGVDLTAVTLAAPTSYDHSLYPSPAAPVAAGSAGTDVAGNIVPATQGVRRTETFTIPDPTAFPPGPVVVRVGANWTPSDPLPDYRYCLAVAPLAWSASGVEDEDTTVPATPEIVLLEQGTGGAESPWLFKRWLLDSGPTNEDFTLTPEQYSPVLVSNGSTYWDYDGDGGTTIRFGDGRFGSTPLPGTTFAATYRVGGGSAGNVPADTVTDIAPGQVSLATACTNPFAATGGADAETIVQVRDRAPELFRAEPLRVVRPEDYVAAAETLAWVQQAGTTFRWTGSWLTVFTSADPAGAELPTTDELESLTELLDRERLAGYESYVLPPAYVSIDLRIVVCGKPAYFASDVEAAVLTRLQPGPLRGGGRGFFDHANWGFGQALESSALLAAIQSCIGVDGVFSVSYRQRGVQLDWGPLPDSVPVASNEILRVDNDPSRPEAGSLQVTVEGSK